MSHEFQHVRYLRRNMREPYPGWAEAQSNAQRERAQNWRNTLSNISYELSPSEAMQHGRTLTAMRHSLEAGFLPPEGQSLASGAGAQAALQFITRRELQRPDCHKRPYLRNLIEMRPNMEWRDLAHGDTLLVQWGKSPTAPIEAAQHMWRLGANVNAHNYEGATATMWRTMHKRVRDVAVLLVDMEANPAVPDRSGLTAPAIAQQLVQASPNSLRAKALVKIFAAHSQRAPREDILAIEQECYLARRTRRENAAAQNAALAG